MTTTLKTSMVTLAALAGLFTSSATAQVVPLNPFVELGAASNDSVASGLSATGGTLTYTGSNNTANDSGLAATLSSVHTFVNAGESVTYSFTVGSIVNDFNSANTFRSGFDFGGSNTGAAHFITGVGTSVDARIFANNNGNPFSSGSQFGTTNSTFLSPSTSLRFANGNTVDVLLTLTYDGPGTGSTHNYTLSGVYSSGANTTVVYSESITNLILSTSIVSVYNLTNIAGIENNGNTWTISNAQFEVIPEPSAFAALAGLGALGLVALRRRRA